MATPAVPTVLATPATPPPVVLGLTPAQISAMQAVSATAAEKCVTSSGFGISHPYSHCVKPSGDMVGTQVTSDKFTMKNTGAVLGGIMNYVEYITINADKGTTEGCKDPVTKKGVIGNKYVLKTNIKCRPVVTTAAGTTVSGEAFLHKYIDNTTTLGGFLTGGAPQDDANGLLPATFASAGKIGDNVIDVIKAFSADSNPYCYPVKLKCHIVDKSDSNNSYFGSSPDVHLSLVDIKRIHESSFEGGRKPPVPVAPVTSRTGFTNLFENIITQNEDKLQNVSAIETVTNTINFEDELIVKLYYVGFSIFLIILIFKLINKSNK
jgi:hypothetical protein